LNIALIRKNYTHYGGAENYLRLVAGELTATGHHVHIFSSGNWPDPFRVCKIRNFSKPSFISNILFAVESKAALKKEPIDCILSFERTFFQDIYRAGDGCHKEWLNKRKKVEPVFKKMSFSLNPHHLVLLYLEKQCFLNSQIIIANSMMVKRDIMKHYSIPDEKIHVIYNGVALQRFQPIKKEQKAVQKDLFHIKEEKVVLFVGADLKRKGLPALFKAFSLLDVKDIRLIVAGRYPGVQHLSMAKNLGIDKHITFWGEEEKIEQLYSVSDVFVLPTIYDPFSNATLEAMASGLSVVTTADNGASELIEDGVQGFSVDDPLDAEALAESISSALLHSEDMGRQARMRAEGYPIRKAIDEIINVISEHGG
jgi:UDP-glucose:(heptosyl)LPS alpha-1,3-glucosyltransferase